MNLWIPDILRAITFGRQFLKESKSKYFLAIAEEWMILNCTSQMQFITRKIDHPPVLRSGTLGFRKKRMTSAGY